MKKGLKYYYMENGKKKFGKEKPKTKTFIKFDSKKKHVTFYKQISFTHQNIAVKDLLIKSQKKCRDDEFESMKCDIDLFVDNCNIYGEWSLAKQTGIDQTKISELFKSYFIHLKTKQPSMQCPIEKLPEKIKEFQHFEKLYWYEKRPAASWDRVGILTSKKPTLDLNRKLYCEVFPTDSSKVVFYWQYRINFAFFVKYGKFSHADNTDVDVKRIVHIDLNDLAENFSSISWKVQQTPHPEVLPIEDKIKEQKLIELVKVYPEYEQFYSDYEYCYISSSDDESSETLNELIVDSFNVSDDNSLKHYKETIHSF